MAILYIYSIQNIYSKGVVKALKFLVVGRELKMSGKRTLDLAERVEFDLCDITRFLNLKYVLLSKK